ncbi:MAG: potassium-transporting ATPase KdpC subunit [Actinomycetota bacterium]|nr:potassium-transporting ATPase KdpC subunit [Actinomycetota bacterium]
MFTDTILAPAGSPEPSGPAARGRPGRGTWRQYLAAVRVLLALTVVLGLAYPLGVTGVAQLPGLRDKATGSPVRNASGQVIGSRLLGQGFLDTGGWPLREWFQPRPSAASSGASNLGPSNPNLVRAIGDRRAAIAAFDSLPGRRVDPDQVPADAVTSSGSGLDPDISPAYARQQAYRVAAARRLDASALLALVEDQVQGRDLGFLGEPRVNVLELNLAVERLRP